MSGPVLGALTAILLAAGPGDELLAADRAFDAAVAARDAAAFLSRVAPDAVFVGSTVSRGRDAVWEKWSRYFVPDGPRLRWKPTDAAMAGSGDLGWTLGDAVYEWKQKGESAPDLRYVTVWRKDAAGKWVVALDAPLTPAPPGAVRRTPSVTLTSGDGRLEASFGSFVRSEGAAEKKGAYVLVRERLADDWHVVVESEVPLR